MAQTKEQPIMSLAYKAGYDDGYSGGQLHREGKSTYWDWGTIHGDGSDYPKGYSAGYYDGYMGNAPMALELTIEEPEDGGPQIYILTYENTSVKVSQ